MGCFIRPRCAQSCPPLNTLRAKIEEHARQGLVLPPLGRPSEELPRYRRFLKLESHRLRMFVRSGGGGVEACRARSLMTDLLVRHLWDATLRLTTGGKSMPRVALVAFGGYGRSELCPMSDIDLMFLHDDVGDAASRENKAFTDCVTGVLYPLWDLGFKLGNVSRTVDYCIQLANSDMQSKTSMLEARRVAGDESLFREFESRFQKECVKGHAREYVQQRLADQQARRLKHGNSPALQEPNIKNGVGGLRDFQNLLWMAFFQERTRTLKDLQEREFMGPAERRQLEAAHDFLLRTRTELHHVAMRPADVLAANVQPAVASGLGYDERSTRARVEHFIDRKSTRLNSSHEWISRMPSSA